MEYKIAFIIALTIGVVSFLTLYYSHCDKNENDNYSNNIGNCNYSNNIGNTNEDEFSSFKEIVIDNSTKRDKYILIDEETGVQYIYICGTHGSVAITPRLDSDGNIMKEETDTEGK